MPDHGPASLAEIGQALSHRSLLHFVVVTRVSAPAPADTAMTPGLISTAPAARRAAGNDPIERPPRRSADPDLADMLQVTRDALCAVTYG